MRGISLNWLLIILCTGALSLAQIPNNIPLTPQFNTNSSVNLSRPVWMGEMPGQPGHFIVLEQHEASVTILYNGGTGYTSSSFYQLNVRTANEEGLLGMAFHPNFAANRKYYIYYTAPSGARSSIIEERTASADFTQDSGDSGIVIITIGEPESNHNGGSIGFGPDGFLYIGLGDGGGGGDVHGTIGNGQDRNTLLGSILRIDVDNQADGNNYAIPSDNPFVGVSGVRPEIWAYGVRNPWRWSFDPLTGDFWLGDVGQSAHEEVGVVGAGQNMGWRVMEGLSCYNAQNCNNAGMEAPYIDYPRGTGTSVTGGYVFRADPQSPFYGIYIFGDYNSRNIWALTGSAGNYSMTQIAQSPEQISSFATDASGRIYVVGHAGTIYLMDHQALQPSSTQGRPKANNPAFFRKAADGEFIFNLSKYPGTRGLGLYTMDGAKILEADQKALAVPLKVKSGVYVARLKGTGEKITQVIYLD